MNGADPAEEAIFNVARLLRDSEKLGAYLDLACDGKPELRRRIEGLLGAAPAADAFFKRHTAPFGHVIAPLAAGATVGNSISEGAGTMIGRYKLLEQIGEGGCGVVYMAEQEEPVRRRVALKIIKLGMDTRNVIARFEAERQALALMDHPNIAKVHDAGATETGRPYFVMELVRGVKITDYCDEKNLSTRERLGLFSLVCHAIQHAHQKGIIHRDIKPSNVLVTVNDGVAVPKVIDFGISKATTDQPLADKTVFTAFEQFIGTPAYMSPEQAAITSVDVDTRSDIYSLGVLLYELLTSRTPFDAKELLQAGLEEMRRTLREREPERPSTRVSTLDGEELTATAKRRALEPPKLVSLLRGDLDWIVMKCLEKDRARRYETANGLASDIQRHLNNEPVIACPPSNFYRFQKLLRRNKLAFTAAGAVAAALVIGLGVSTWMYFQERIAEQEQARLRQQAQTEAAKSQQVAGFLKKMLQGVGPSVSRGRETTMLREILDQTVKSIGNDLTNRPEVEVELCLTLADTYADLGLYDKMEQVASQSLRVARSRLGEENESVADSLISLGIGLLKLGQLHLGVMHYGSVDEAEKFRRLHDERLVEAEKCGREGLAMTRRLRGKENPEVARALNLLANVLATQYRMAEAEVLQREVLAMDMKLLGKEHPRVAKMLHELAIFLVFQDHREAEAEDINRQALALQRKLLGEDHPDIAKSLFNEGLVLARQGRWAEAEAQYLEALMMWRKLQANDRIEVADTLHNLAEMLRVQGKLVEAETRQREALIMQRKLSGNDHLDVAESLVNLANILMQQGKLGDAETIFREALAMRSKLLGHEHLEVAWSLSGLGHVLRQQGKLEDAETSYREALAIMRKLPGEEHGYVVRSLSNLASLLETRDSLAEAETTYREALAIQRKLAGNADPSTIELAKGLKALLERVGKQTEAQALAEELPASNTEKNSKPR